MRLDVYLFENNFYDSREKARRAIIEEAVTVNGVAMVKPSFDVGENDEIVIIKETNPFVGRGGLKLQRAIEHFGLNLTGAYALDVGASTGGFTDCMLKNNAATVVACDVGSAQLADSLRNDNRVVSLENTDIRTLLAASEYLDRFDFVSVDVSFISLTKVIPYVIPLMKSGAQMVCLIKPQFEVGGLGGSTDGKTKTGKVGKIGKNGNMLDVIAEKYQSEEADCIGVVITENRQVGRIGKVGKKGVIRDPKIHKKVCDEIKVFAQSTGLCVNDIIESPITGGDGNKEFLMLCER